MHVAIGRWLNGPTGRDNKTVLQYLAELIAVNRGSYELTQLGPVQPNETAWGRVGLTPQEALDLVKLTAFLAGMMSIVGEADGPEVNQLIQAEINRVERGSNIYIPTTVEVNSFGRG